MKVSTEHQSIHNTTLYWIGIHKRLNSHHGACGLEPWNLNVVAPLVKLFVTCKLMMRSRLMT